MADAERVQQLLALAAEPPGPPLNPPGPDLLHRAVRRQRRRRALAVVGTAVAVLLVATPAALRHGARPSPSAAAPAAPTAVLHAAAPLLFSPSGGASGRPQPPCRASDVRGWARLTASRYGVLGIVMLRGTRCSLHVDPQTLTLLDTTGRSLGLAVLAERVPNPAMSLFPGSAEARGNVAVGFSWRGGWCGARAARARLTAVAAGYPNAHAGAAVVEVPVVGSSPRCDPAALGSSYLVPGLVGGPGEAVITPPPAWAALRASLQLPADVAGTTVTTYRVQIRNTGPTPVTLSPCPDYAVLVSGNVNGLLEETGGFGSLPCGRALAPRSVLLLSLHVNADVSYTPGVVHLSWAMAGVPTATGTVRIR